MTSDTAGGAAGLRADASPAIAERRLHPAYMVIRAGRTGRALVPVAAIAIWRWPWWVLVAIVLAVIATSAGRWWQHRYQVSDGYLRVRAGIVRRTAEAVPLTRITALDARRSLVQRLFGVWELKVQVPGDGVRSAVVLSCLSTRRLMELRAALDPAGRVGTQHLDGTRSTPVATPVSRATARPATPVGPSDEVTALPQPDGRGSASRLSGDIGREVPPGPATQPWPTPSDAPAPPPQAPTGGRVGVTPDTGQATPEVLLARLDLRTLLVTAVTGTSVPLIVAGGFAAWNRARELLPQRTIGWAEREVFSRGGATVAILALLFLLAVVVSVGITSLRLAGFTLSRQGDVLRIRRGLLTEHSGTVVVDRVQAVRLVEGLWRRALGYAAIEVEVAGVAGSDAERLMFPLIRTADAVDLVRRALPELAWVDGPTQSAPRRAWRRYSTIPLCWAAVATLAGVLVLPGWGPWLGALPIPFALLVGRARARAAAWRCDRDTVTLRWHRVFTRHTLIARRRRVQITRVTRSVWQRRAGLAGFHATLSTRRTGSVAHLDLVDADLLQRTTGRRDPVLPR